jgi:hypothetical protein
MAAVANALFDSDDSDGDWEGFPAQDIPENAGIDGRDINFSDIEVSSVNSSDLSDFSEGENDNGHMEDLEAAGIDGQQGDVPGGAPAVVNAPVANCWSQTLTNVAKNPFIGPNPGPRQTLPETATEIDFFSLFFSPDLIEVWNDSDYNLYYL